MNSTAFRALPVGAPDAGWVLYDGDILFGANGIDVLMVWDVGLGNIRAMTDAEIAALPAQKRAAEDASEPDLATLRDQAVQAIGDITTFLAIPNPTNAQLAAEVKAIDQRQRAIIKALARLAVRTLN